jgi:hypothetical protein
VYTAPSPHFFEMIKPLEKWKFLIFKSNKMGGPSKAWQIPGKIHKRDGFQILILCFVHLISCHWFSVIWNNCLYFIFVLQTDEQCQRNQPISFLFHSLTGSWLRRDMLLNLHIEDSAFLFYCHNYDYTVFNLKK